MKKLFPLLLGGVSLISVALGLFISKAPTKVAAADTYLVVDNDEEITLGSLPSAYDKAETEELNNVGYDNYIGERGYVGDFLGKHVFDYNGNRYLHEPSMHFYNQQRYVTLGGEQMKAEHLEGQQAMFKYEPIEWAKIEKDGDYTLYASKRAILREKLDDTREMVDFYDSSLRNTLRQIVSDPTLPLFNDQEYSYLGLIDLDDKTTTTLSIPSKKQAPTYVGPSEYVKCNGISIENGEDTSPYWLIDRENVGEPRNIAYDGHHSAMDDMVGVRALIKVRVQVRGQGGGGGGGTPSTPIFNINFTGNLALLIVGFVLLAGGFVFLIIFVIKWSKKLKLNPKFRHPWWYYLLLGISVTIIIIGANLYAYGTMLKLGFAGIPGQKAEIYGLYMSGTYIDNEEFSFSYGMYALTKDGKVYHYFGDIYYPNRRLDREEGEGSYVVNGDEITITYPESWTVFSFEHSPMTYKISIGEYWEVHFYLDYDVSFRYSVPPLVTGSGLYNKNSASAFANHNPDGRAYYTVKDLGLG